MKPLISVVTVCFNAVHEIEKTILSVINQAYPNLEYLIIDGGSTDGTMDIVNRYRDKIAVIISEPDKGIYDAMNKGIARATGEWINFMNAGDEFCCSHVIESIFEQRITEEYALIYGNHKELKEGSYISVFPKPFFEVNKFIMFHGKGICHQCIFLRRVIAKEIPFSLKYPICDDFYQVYNIYKKHPTSFLYLNVDIANFDSNGISCTNKEQVYYENYSILHNGTIINKAVFIFFMKLARFFKKCFKGK